MANVPEPLPPEHRVHPSMVRAAVSPSAAVATAAGAGIGLLDRSIILAAVLAICGWSGRVIVAFAQRRRHERAVRPRPAQLDPWSLPEPWRQLVQQAQAIQSRYDQAFTTWPPGPTRDRLAGLQPRVYEEVSRLGATARQGAAAGGWTSAMPAAGKPSVDSLASELKQLEAKRARLGDGAPARLADLNRREEAVAAQLRAAHQSSRAEAEIQDRLRQAVARLDETITELLVVESTRSGADPGGLGSRLDELTDGLASLQAAITETAGTPPDRATP